MVSNEDFRNSLKKSISILLKKINNEIATFKLMNSKFLNYWSEEHVNNVGCLIFPKEINKKKTVNSSWIPFNYNERKIFQFPVKYNYVKTIKIMESSLTSSFKISIPLHLITL